MFDHSSKRIVLATWGSFGDLHPYMALALELQRRGHRAVVATLEFYREKVEGAGIGFHPVRPDLPPSEAAVDVIRRILDPVDGPRYIFQELLVSHLREIYADTMAAAVAGGGADLLVSHPLTLAVPLVAGRTGIPWVSTVLAPISFFSVYDPPSPPYGSALRRIFALHPVLARGFTRLGKRMTRSWVAPVTQLREELGLPPAGHPLFEGQHSPQRVLGLFSEVFGPMQPDFPANTRLTGFPFYDAGEVRPMAPELERFLDEGEPPILFTLGSSAYWVAGNFFRVSVEAARKLGRRALLLTGDHGGTDPGRLPSGIAAFDYAPYGAVMARSSVVVHQGGVGTTAQGLRSGRPALIMPFGHDTPDNARRVSELGAGKILSRKRYTPTRVAAALSDLLTNVKYQENAQRVAMKIRAEDGVGAACDAIEECAAGGPVRRQRPS